MSQRILCYGDSNTCGYDPRSYLGGRYPKSVRWTSLLNVNGWEVINEGENGRCIPQSDDEIKAVAQSLRSTRAEILVMMLGSNDLLRHPVLSAEMNGSRFSNIFIEKRDSSFPKPIDALRFYGFASMYWLSQNSRNPELLFLLRSLI